MKTRKNLMPKLLAGGVGILLMVAAVLGWRTYFRIQRYDEIGRRTEELLVEQAQSPFSTIAAQTIPVPWILRASLN